MIKANEIRLGNWVSEQGPDGKIHYFQMSIDFLEALEAEPGLFDPIPLTPEILEKCGFEEWAKGNWKLPEVLCLNGWSNKFNYYEPYQVLSTYTGNVYLQYVHQLQNLYFALTGEEISIDM